MERWVCVIISHRHTHIFKGIYFQKGDFVGALLLLIKFAHYCRKYMILFVFEIMERWVCVIILHRHTHIFKRISFQKGDFVGVLLFLSKFADYCRQSCLSGIFVNCAVKLFITQINHSKFRLGLIAITFQNLSFEVGRAHLFIVYPRYIFCDSVTSKCSTVCLNYSYIGWAKLKQLTI